MKQTYEEQLKDINQIHIHAHANIIEQKNSRENKFA